MRSHYEEGARNIHSADPNADCGWLKSVRVRNVLREDLPALEWEGEFTHFRRLYTEIFASARRGNAVMWIAEMEQFGVIGQLFVQLISGRLELANGRDRAYIYGFRVRPEYRGCGVGTLLMESAERDLVRRGFYRVTLNVSRDNPDARRLYEGRGYKVVGNEPGRWSYRDHMGKKHHVNEPAWRMEKDLNHR